MSTKDSIMTVAHKSQTLPEGRPSTTVLVMVLDNVLRDTIYRALAHEGYDVVVADDSSTGLSVAQTRSFDLILLDTLLTPLDGLTCCRLLRRDRDVPILLLSSDQDAMDGIVGLELGADDYIVKPVRLVELLARIHALLRRSTRRISVLPREVLVIGELRVDVGARRVFRGTREVLLPPKEFDLLVFFMRHCGTTLSRETLHKQVWGPEQVIAARTVDVHIRWLREKIEADPSQPLYIRTVRSSGYRFEGPTSSASFQPSSTTNVADSSATA
jgi:DNA-binding response OmpR family regulator